MCLATVYKNTDHTVLMRNAARIDVEGDTVIITDILGDQVSIPGRILWVDLAGSEAAIETE